MKNAASIITLTRNKSVSNMFRQFGVLIDDKRVGKIKSGETKKFRVSAGHHTLRITLDLYKSKQLLLKLAAGERVILECGDTAPATWRESLSLKGLEKSLNSLVSPSQYLYLRRTGSGQQAAADDHQRRKSNPADKGCRIFISYRRDDSLHVTGRICDHLSYRFGQQSVFRDLDSMPLGVDFRKHIEQTIDRCSVLLAIIGKDWLNTVDDSGGRRLEDPEDPVRVEIEAALERNIPVIPILVKGALMPDQRALPENIRQLKYQAGITIHEDYFKEGMERLIEQLQIAGRPGAEPQSAAKKNSFCIYCGASINPGNKFCIHCGKAV